MESTMREFEKWLSQRPAWLQHATNKILLGNINGKDIDDLVSICKAEVENGGGIVTEPPKLRMGKIGGGAEDTQITIDHLSDIKGVNALSPRSPLKFSEGLNIIYGQNGSGKSSYVRLFKHLCGSKNSGFLYGNVYKDKVDQKCKIKYKINGENREVNWDPNKGGLEDLSLVEIYDADDAHTYINDENEATYEPFVLRLISELIEVCNKVGLKINREMDEYVSVLPSLPKKYAMTESAKWYGQVNRNISLEEVKSICNWDNRLEDTLTELINRVAETNPMDKARAIRKNIDNINRIVNMIDKLHLEISDEKCRLLYDAKQNAELKRKVAEDDAKKVFGNAPINTIDNESWRLLWEQARKFSETHVYETKQYPNVDEGALCVLCQQPVSEDTKNRLTSFEDYVQGNLEKEAKSAENELEKLVKGIPNISDNSSFDLMLDSAGIHNEADRDTLKSILEDIRVRRDDILAFKNIVDINHFPEHDYINSLKGSITMLENQAKTFEEDAKDEKRDILQKQIITLEAKKWLNEQKDNVIKEIARLKRIHRLEEAKRLTRTQSLSTKKSALSKELITEAYIKRFEQELALLGASYINIKLVKTRTLRGQVLHEIKLSNPKTNVKAAEILSEGEKRIVSFAAFLADINGKQANSPLVLDDPISSLDQEYEETIAARLADMSRFKQIIVFTHRISLLTLLEEAAKTNGINTEIIGVRHEFWGSGEPGGTSFFAKKPESALNTIYNERLPKAKKILEEVGGEEYEPIAKGICSDFRIILERAIETHLLFDIVRRFRRSITTLGKINNLYKIKQSDCEMFDTLMTKYSRYEHSQSTEAPVFMPGPDELKADVEKVLGWIKEFKKR
jgi:energy-coupling factor transporter ATP-binding protein EcfA2